MCITSQNAITKKTSNQIRFRRCNNFKDYWFQNARLPSKTFDDVQPIFKAKIQSYFQLTVFSDQLKKKKSKHKTHLYHCTSSSNTNTPIKYCHLNPDFEIPNRCTTVSSHQGMSSKVKIIVLRIVLYTRNNSALDDVITDIYWLERYIRKVIKKIDPETKAGGGGDDQLVMKSNLWD